MPQGHIAERPRQDPARAGEKPFPDLFQRLDPPLPVPYPDLEPGDHERLLLGENAKLEERAIAAERLLFAPDPHERAGPDGKRRPRIPERFDRLDGRPELPLAQEGPGRLDARVPGIEPAFLDPDQERLRPARVSLAHEIRDVGRHLLRKGVLCFRSPAEELLLEDRVPEPLRELDPEPQGPRIFGIEIEGQAERVRRLFGAVVLERHAQHARRDPSEIGKERPRALQIGE